MIELLITKEANAWWAFGFLAISVVAGIGCIIFGLWPRYGYKHPEGRYLLQSSDYKDGPFGIWMKVSTFRMIVCSYGLLLIVLGIISYPVIASI